MMELGNIGSYKEPGGAEPTLQVRILFRSMNFAWMAKLDRRSPIKGPVDRKVSAHRAGSNPAPRSILNEADSNTI